MDREKYGRKAPKEKAGKKDEINMTERYKHVMYTLPKA